MKQVFPRLFCLYTFGTWFCPGLLGALTPPVETFPPAVILLFREREETDTPDTVQLDLTICFFIFFSSFTTLFSFLRMSTLMSA